VGLERGPLGLVSTTGEQLGRKSSGSGSETGNTAVVIRHADQFDTNFVDKRRSLGRYNSFADSGHGDYIRIVTA
jgi:hypothetical protein